VIGPRERRGKHLYWKCRCDCGVEKVIRREVLKYGKAVSCGCIKLKLIGNVHRTHGASKHPLYNVWKKISDRCYNENGTSWKNYGGRGISVCDEWRNDMWSFMAWAVSNGYRPGLSIDRIDNDGNYEPGNCRWATALMQSRNRRPRAKVGK
jgi:hypothetical protein